MEERKLVKSGLFSYTLALPKEWVVRHKLAKGSKIYLSEEHDSIILTPSAIKAREKTKRHRVLKVDDISPSTLSRDIIASYLTNCATITLEGKKLKNYLKICREATAQLPGLEVIEETGDYIVLKDFISIEELIVPDIIRRADNIIRSLFLDAFECLQTGDAALAEAIRQRDKEVNRLSFLVSKCLYHINEQPQESRMHGVETLHRTHIWELNNYLEKIGDEIKRFAVLIPKAKLYQKDGREIEALFRSVELFYTKTMSALYKGNTQEADEIAGRRQEIMHACDEYLAKSQSTAKNAIVSKLNYLISFINSISRLIRYIAFEKHMIINSKDVTLGAQH